MTYLVEQAVEIDVDGVARSTVEENILAVTVAEPVDRIEYGRVRQPSYRLPMYEATYPSTKPTIEMTAAVRE